MSGRIPDNIIDDISSKLNIVDIAQSYVNLKQKGDRWWGLCPFHTEKSPSFTVSPENNVFYCFGCQRGGGLFKFVMEIEGASFPEAVSILAGKAGVSLEQETDNGLANDRKILFELYTRVSHTFHWLLFNKPEAHIARDYLKKRGISRETASEYRIGWSPGESEWLWNFLYSKNYTARTLNNSGLFGKKQKHRTLFKNRLMFPLMRDQDKVLAFSGRALDHYGPKYINTPETILFKKSRELYGWSQARQNIRKLKSALLCEGAMDVLSCAQAGAGNAIAPLGTAFGLDQARLVQRYAESLTLLFDSDNAGRTATEKAAVTGEQANLEVRVSILPENMDPSDVLVMRGEGYLENLAKNTVNVYDYLLNFHTGGRHVFSGREKENILEKLTPYLLSVDSEIRREAYIQKLAEVIKTNTDIVERHVRRNNTSTTVVKGFDSIPAEAEFVSDELYLLTSVAIHCEYFEFLRKHVSPEMLEDNRALVIYRTMDELHSKGMSVNLENVLQELDESIVKRHIVESAAKNMDGGNVREHIILGIRRLVKKWYVEEKKELMGHLGHSDIVGAETNQNAILTRIREIDSEIMNLENKLLT